MEDLSYFMKFIITRASVLTLFAVVLSFLSTSISADPWQDGFNTGKATCQVCQACPSCPSQNCPTKTCPTCQTCPAQQACPTCDNDYQRGKRECRSNPASCGITITQNDPNAITQAGKEAGKRECQTNPQSCGITITPHDPNAITQAGKEAGKRECQRNPQFCGITPHDPNAITQAGKTAGIQSCQTNPASCGAHKPEEVTAATEAGLYAGIQTCQNNPASCGLKTPQELTVAEDAAKTAGIQACQTNPASCGLNKPEEVTAAREEGKEAGIQSCQTNPANCGLNKPEDVSAAKEAGKEAGKNACRENPATEGCYIQLSTATVDIPNDFCDNKTCFSSKHGQLYLPTVELDNNNDRFLKDIKMDALVGISDLILVSNIEALNDHLFEKTELKIEIEGKDKGGVISSPDGIFCGEDCDENYEKGSTVTLVAAPLDSEFIFAGWSGDTACNGTSRIIPVQMNSAKTCTATFEAKEEAPDDSDTLPLTLSISGDGEGTVTSQPDGINCNNNDDSCEEAFPKSTVVALTAKPKSASSFIRWDGDCAKTLSTQERTIATIAVSMDEAENCEAQFGENYLLEVELEGDGIGTVISKVVGINCPNNCTRKYPRDTTYVFLNAKPDGDSSFVEWGGDCTDDVTETIIAVRMDKNKTCNAKFELKTGSDSSDSASKSYQLTVEITGEGTVKSNDSKIDCSSTDDPKCQANYDSEKAVKLTLTAEAEADSEFQQWADCNDSTDDSITVTMDEDKTCTAMFASVVTLPFIN